MAPRSLADLPVRERRRAVIRSLVRFVSIFAVIIAGYYLLPLSGVSGGAVAIARLVLGAMLFIAVMGWEVHRIVTADLPELRAAESLAIAVPFFLTTYAAAYVTLSALSPGSFTQAMNRTGGLYFSVVTFGTVGYGDIAPVSDLARILVITQVLGDLVFIALVLRIVANASRFGLRRSGAERAHPSAARAISVGQPTGAARPSITTAPGSSASAAPSSTSFEPRIPDPMTTGPAAATAASIMIGQPSGSPTGVMPPYSMPVCVTASSIAANDTFRTSRRRRTTPLTSALVVARITAAAQRCSPARLPLTTTQFADAASGTW